MWNKVLFLTSALVVEIRPLSVVLTSDGFALGAIAELVVRVAGVTGKDLVLVSFFGVFLVKDKVWHVLILKSRFVMAYG